MAVVFAECGSCHGGTTSVGSYQEAPVVEGSVIFKPEWDLDALVDQEIGVCSDCQGRKGPDGVAYSRYERFSSFGKPYASTATLKAALTRGKAVRCKQCLGTGSTARLQFLTECYTCTGTGRRVASFAPGDRLPDDVNLYGDPISVKDWADAVEIVPLASKAMSWGDMNLGLGNVITIGDHGTMARLAATEGPGAAVAKARESLAKHTTQWLNYADKESRIIAERLVLVVSPQGWKLVSQASLAGKPKAGLLSGLPPTYTDEVLNRPAF